MSQPLYNVIVSLTIKEEAASGCAEAASRISVLGQSVSERYGIPRSDHDLLFRHERPSVIINIAAVQTEQRLPFWNIQILGKLAEGAFRAEDASAIELRRASLVQADRFIERPVLQVFLFEIRELAFRKPREVRHDRDAIGSMNTLERDDALVRDELKECAVLFGGLCHPAAKLDRARLIARFLAGLREALRLYVEQGFQEMQMAALVAHERAFAWPLYEISRVDKLLHGTAYGDAAYQEALLKLGLRRNGFADAIGAAVDIVLYSCKDLHVQRKR